MVVDIFTLCDSAHEYNGKLVIIGTFDRITSDKFPMIFPECAIVARIGFPKEEKGKHHIEICIKKDVDELIYLLNPVSMEADNSDTNEYSLVNVIIKGNNILVPSSGTYKVVLKIDDEIRESLLHVTQK